MKKTFAAVFAVAFGLAFSGAAEASCRIRNATGISWTVESGNTGNQRVGSHTTTSIDDGRIIAKGDKGETTSGSCKDGDQLEIVMDRGVPVIVHK